MEKTAFVFVYCMVFCLSIISGSGEQEERSRSVFRRNSGGAAEYQLRFAHDSFVATSDATVERLIDSHPPLLVHTREKVNQTVVIDSPSTLVSRAIAPSGKRGRS